MKKLIQSANDLEALEKELMAAPAIGFDIETTDLKPQVGDLVGCSFAAYKNQSHQPSTYIPVAHRMDLLSESVNVEVETVVKFITKILASHQEVWCHNAAFEGSWGLKYGWRLDFGEDGRVGSARDSMIACWLVSAPHALDKAMASLFNIRRQKYKEVTGGKSMSELAAEDVQAYGSFDAADTVRLGKYLEPYLEKLGLLDLFLRLEMPFIEVLMYMDYHGIRVDSEMLRRASAEMIQKKGEVEAEAAALLGETISLNSTKAVSTMAFDRKKIWQPTDKMARGKNGCYSTGDPIIEDMIRTLPKESVGREFALMLREYRHYEKYRSTYTLNVVAGAEKFPDDRLHVAYNQHGTATGRLSASIVHQVPRPEDDMPNLRAAFVPEEGNIFVNADYSQIELRLTAHFSGDTRLVQVYRENGDIHQTTADQCGCSRQEAKPINFGLIYGKWWGTLAWDLNISNDQAKQYWERYFTAYSGIRWLQDNCFARVEKDGFMKSITGRYRFFPEMRDRTDMIPWQVARKKATEWNDLQSVRRQAINTLIQASAGDLLKIAMRNLFRKWKKEKLLGQVKFVLQVHDEIMVECPPELADQVKDDMKKEMEAVATLNVPLLSEPKVGKSWAECK